LGAESADRADEVATLVAKIATTRDKREPARAYDGVTSIVVVRNGDRNPETV
jgi:hypothetical protein